ncbi:Hypothetical predicted protein, partial [Mytilus galloprovincialis]
MADKMLPFRQLLKPGTPFFWDEHINKLFQESKAAIISEIEESVRIFDKSKPTCLATDWSKTGIGFWLFQKHCSCKGSEPFCCCNTGWRITLVGSRLTHPAKSRYAPVEGEVLAVVDALDKAMYFVLGCDDLIIAVDHKPLLKIFIDRSLEDISNSRLRNLKEKTLRYRFRMIHIPGVKHAADGVSRHPTGDPEKLILLDDIAAIKNSTMSLPPVTSFLSDIHHTDSESDATKIDNSVFILAISSLDSLAVISVTWDRVRTATASDDNMNEPINLIESGTPEFRHEFPPQLREYFQFREHLYTIDGVIIYKDGQNHHSPSFRDEVLSALHAAHQGVTAMISRAESSVFFARETLDAREEVLRNRHIKQGERLSEHAKRLPQLATGDCMRIKNQIGHYPLKWDKTGIIIEVRHFDQYAVKVNGSGRVTLRNRNFLRKYVPVKGIKTTKTIQDDLCYKNIPVPSSFDTKQVLQPTSDTLMRAKTSHSGNAQDNFFIQSPRVENTHPERRRLEFTETPLENQGTQPTTNTPPLIITPTELTPQRKSSRASRPSAWHSDYSVSGSCMYLDSAGATKGDIAYTKSSSMKVNRKSCLTFWYHMFGEDMGRLNVTLNTNHIWSEYGDKGDKWNIATIDIDPQDNFSFQFVGIYGSGGACDIAIDDILLLPGSCSGLSDHKNVCVDLDDVPPEKTYCPRGYLDFTNSSLIFEPEKTDLYCSEIYHQTKTRLRTDCRNRNDSQKCVIDLSTDKRSHPECFQLNELQILYTCEEFEDETTTFSTDSKSREASSS